MLAAASAYSFAEGYTVNMDEPVVLRMYHSGDGMAGYQVSLTVQTTDKSVFVAERPLYWNTGSTQGVMMFWATSAANPDCHLGRTSRTYP